MTDVLTEEQRKGILDSSHGRLGNPKEACSSILQAMSTM